MTPSWIHGNNLLLLLMISTAQRNASMFCMPYAVDIWPHSKDLLSWSCIGKMAAKYKPSFECTNICLGLLVQLLQPMRHSDVTWPTGISAVPSYMTSSVCSEKRSCKIITSYEDDKQTINEIKKCYDAIHTLWYFGCFDAVLKFHKSTGLFPYPPSVKWKVPN